MAGVTQTTTAAVSGSISAALLTVITSVDTRVGYDMGVEFWGAVILILFALPAFIVAAIRWVIRLKKTIKEESENDQANTAGS